MTTCIIHYFTHKGFNFFFEFVDVFTTCSVSHVGKLNKCM